jgi:subtilisin-like proprotein convertase family protein
MEAALLAGVTYGRNGKGVVYVWAAGNGRNYNQDINYDGFASSRFTIAVGASGGDGVFSYYSEPGASMLVNAPSSFTSSGLSRGTWSTTGTTDFTDYTTNFGGTSSAAPLVSGIVALMLEANPNLTWRDIQHILVATSTKIDIGHTDWFLNGAGNLFSHTYGFGRVHAVNAVATASTWINVDPWTVLSDSRSTAEDIPDNDAAGVSQILSMFSSTDFIIEHVELTVNISHTFRGDLVITLQSPGGTRSVLTSLHTDSADDYDDWKFTSVAHWGEDPVGEWTLKVSDGNALDVGTLNNWSLQIYGTAPGEGAIPTMKVPFFSKP